VPIEPGQTLLHYRIVDKLGEGGMGAVWRAVDTTLDREVAIKVLPEGLSADPERVARFDREAKVVASLNHPNIAAVHSVHAHEGLRFISMELVPGEDLAAVLQRGRVNRDDALRIAMQIAKALEAAHARGVVHRDLKPANIQIDPEGNAKVLDFGLAKALALSGEATGGVGAVSQSLSPTLTSAGTVAGMILGTAGYMSPEQARGKAADRRADIWAFGCVLFEMLSGQRVFEGETVSDTLASVLKSDPDFDKLSTDIPAAVRRLLRRCLHKDPHHRLHDAADARIVLEEVAAGVVDEQGAQAPPTEEGLSRRTLLLMVASGLAAAALTFVVMAFLPASAPSDTSTVFPIPAPRGTRLEQVAVSPDGKSFAFVAESPSGFTEIWIRDLNSREVRKLEGTGGARDLFWSPDSRFIGYFSEEFVWKIEVASGAVEKLAAISQTRGGSWNQHDTIMIGGPKLVSVPATGGEVTTVVERDQDTGENALRFPHFLPDGNHVLFYSRNAEDSGRSGLWSVALDTGNRKHLAPEATSSAIYVESGELLYRRDRYLVARPFDARTLEFTGDSNIVDEDVWYEPGVTAQTDVSASKTGMVTFRTGGPEVTELTWFDRQGNRAGTVWEPKSFITVGLSHDEKQLITGFPGQGVNREVWLYDITAASARQIEAPGDLAGSALFSEDGSRALLQLYTGANMLPWMTELASGAPPKTLEVKHTTALATDWHDDLIVYEGSEGEGEDARSSLNVLDLATGEDRTVVDGPGEQSFGSISPDGRWMSYSSDETGQFDIYVASFPDGERRWRISTAGGHQPRWNPQGGELFFLSSDRKMMSVRVLGGSSVFRWEAPRPLFQTDVADLGPHRGSWTYAVAPDGDRLLILTRQPQGTSPAVAILNWR
jgi:Tol biopolymer transport system component/tRNA A-37 threonylcarbamoyl transferase component Bud32